MFFFPPQLEDVEAPVVRAVWPVLVLLPAHGRERPQGDHPAGEREGALRGGGGGRVRQQVLLRGLLGVERLRQGVQDGLQGHSRAGEPQVLQVIGHI